MNSEVHNCRRGPTSFWMQSPQDVFDVLNLQSGQTFLDLGCGTGDYSWEALSYVGEKGSVYAIDSRKESIARLSFEIADKGLSNMHPVVGDITTPLELKEDSVDLGLLSTVLHSLDRVDFHPLFTELKRVLKKNGAVAILECHKKRKGFGPPEHVRMSPEELGAFLQPYGFKLNVLKEMEHNYLALFRLEETI